MKGSYILLIKLNKDKEIQIGKLGKIFFKKGYYAYIGSALNSLEKRIQRHLRSEKKIHWHIDYLLKNAEIIDVFYKENSEKEECNIAKQLEKEFISIIDFGCSDCKCKSHLFHSNTNSINDVAISVNMKKYLCNEKI